ncbi:zinc finger BED domain-containing protein RICESLEEPER 2 [Tanacetum coccineum]
MSKLLNQLQEHRKKKARNDPSLSSEYERYVNSDFVTLFDNSEFAAFDFLGFWKAKESMFPVLSRMAMDIISVQATSVASESAFSTSGRVSVKRKLPYDSEIECSTTGVSKKQNFDPSDMFAHNSGTNVDNRGLKIPLNMDPLHGDSSSIEISLTQTADLLAHDQQHGTIDIPSQPIIVGPTSTLSGSCAIAAADELMSA